MKRSQKMTRKIKKTEYGTERKWKEAKRKKEANRLNQELNKGD